MLGNLENMRDSKEGIDKENSQDILETVRNPANEEQEKENVKKVFTLFKSLQQETVPGISLFFLSFSFLFFSFSFQGKF